jgi:hypothetical protein
MSTPEARTEEAIRAEIAAEREQLVSAVASLRESVQGGVGVKRQLRAKLPAASAGAFGAGFVLAGGISATMRYFARRSREGNLELKLGRIRIVDRG